MSNPGITEFFRFSLSFLINADSVGDVAESKVVVLFVLDIGQKEIPCHFRNFIFQSIFDKVTNRQFHMPNSQGTVDCFFRTISKFTSCGLDWRPLTFTR